MALHGCGGQRVKVRSNRDAIQVGEGSADLRLVEQLVDPEQAAALAQMVRFAAGRGLLSGQRSIAQVVREVYAEVEEAGLDVLDEHGAAGCGLTLPRPQEFAAALNRWRW